MMDQNMVGVFSIFGAMTVLIVQLIALAMYIFTSYAIYKVAKVRGFEMAWLAFIPIFSLYITGLIGDSLKYLDPKIDNVFTSLPMAYALPISSAIVFIPIIGGLSGLITLVLSLTVYYLIFSFYSYESRILFTALSLIPLAAPILILISLNGRRR